jgi:hypothetical protein
MKYAISLALLIFAAAAVNSGIARAYDERVCIFSGHEIRCRAFTPAVGSALAAYDRHTGSHDQIILFQVKAGKPVAKRIL